LDYEALLSGHEVSVSKKRWLLVILASVSTVALYLPFCILIYRVPLEVWQYIGISESLIAYIAFWTLILYLIGYEKKDKKADDASKDKTD
jgi:carbon starvation protein CstA